MRRATWWGTVLTLVLGGLYAFSPPLASAGANCPPGTHPGMNSQGGVVCIQDPGSGGGGNGGNGNTGGGGGGGEAVCTFKGKKIPCQKNGGIWFASKACYAFPMDPQPGPEVPQWNGHDPSEGTLWACMGRAGNWNEVTQWFFVPNGEEPPLIDPGEVARNAWDSFDFIHPAARLAPLNGRTYLQIRNWLWIDEATWQTLEVTVGVPGTSVTVTATPTEVIWNTGAGTTSCAGPGVAWQKGMTNVDATYCSVVYTDLADPEGDTHQVSASIRYHGTWTCEGACLYGSGDLGYATADAGQPAPLQVFQRQVVTTR